MLTVKVVSYNVEGKENAAGKEAIRFSTEMWHQQLAVNK